MTVMIRETGRLVEARELENGRIEIIGGKTYAKSTFKKYFKEVSAEVAAAVTKEETVAIFTFTGMKIQGEFKAEVVDGNYVVLTKKKGALVFNPETGMQVNCKNPKFANKIVVI